jgi:NADPH:quinone reductase-like Zn-dependent oxidoreductase
MTGAARAFWTVAPGEGEIRVESLAARGRDEVLVRALTSGISRGTESLVFRGRVPPSQYSVMRCPFQAGALPFPVKYGYASVGIVEAGPADLVGRRVFALYPHQDRYILPQTAIVPIPDTVPTPRAVLAANMETALNGLWDAAPRLGDRISVIGAGVVGSLAAALAAGIPGTEVELVDLDPSRAALAARLGAGFATPDRAAGEADLVIHASGNPDGLALALGLAGFEATVLELSWYGDQAVSLPLGEAFHSRRLVLRSSQVGAVAAAQRPRWPYRRRLGLALSLLADPVFDALLTGATPFDDMPATMARLAGVPAGVLCHRITYP